MREPSSQSKVQRPVGLWILTSFAALADGLFPLVLVFLFAGTPTMSILNGVMIAAVAVIVLVACLGAFRGAAWSRLGLPIAVGLYHLMIGYTNGRLLLAGSPPDDLSVRLTGRVVRSLIVPIIYFWYFTRRETVAFFANPSLHPSEIQKADQASDEM